MISAAVSHIVERYSFVEGFIAALDVNPSRGTLVIDFEAVPYLSKHSNYSYVRLTKNSLKGLIYSNADLCNGRMTLSGCEFRGFSLEPSAAPPETKVEFDSNRAIELFDLGVTADDKGTFQLIAEEIRVTCSFEDIAFREVVPNE